MKLICVLLTLLVCACAHDEPAAPSASDGPPLQAVVKVKNLLTGLPVTDDELRAVSEDPGALGDLIDEWLGTDACRGKLLDFFQQAFQQTQLGITQFDDLFGVKTALASSELKTQLLRNAALSFPLTVLQLIDEGRPFHEAVTTDRLMLSTALMSLVTYLDNVVVDDEGQGSTWLAEKFGEAFQITLHMESGVSVPFETSLDPNSEHFLHFYAPCLSTEPAACQTMKVAGADRVPRLILNMLLGRDAAAAAGRGAANGVAPMPTPPQLTAADWNDWRMVHITAPGNGEEPSIFWDLPTFRRPDTDSLRLVTPHAGFMTTLAFFANWPTNASNLARVTVNQALIVGLGYSLADTSAIVPVSETGNPDSQHSQPGTACYGCHQTLDPLRNYFRQSYSVSYHAQTLPLPPEQEVAHFRLGDVDVAGQGVRDFAQIVAEHPWFARAWTQKLCTFANAAPCAESDPELLRVAEVFRASGHNFKKLVRELFSSPLVTASDGAVTIARREHFCVALQNRLGIDDACELAATEVTATQNLAYGIPGAGYARGATTALLPRQSDLFFVSSVEGLCARFADQVVDTAGRVSFRSDDIEAAVAELTTQVMGVPERDPRFDELREILKEHYDDAVREGHAPRVALASTFILACSAPTSSAIGL